MIGLKLNEFYEILGILKNCPAYQDNKKFKKFIEAFEASYWNYVDRKYSSKKDVNLSIFKPFVLRIKLEDFEEAGIAIASKTDDFIPEI